jgi:hypothetical protein
MNQFLFETVNESNKKIVTEIIDVPKDIGINELKIFFIIDSIGALNESIKTHSILGVNYVTTGNITLAKIHKSMEYWTKEMKKYNNITKYIEHILGTNRLWMLDNDYHQSKKSFYNKKAKEMHNQDTEYKNFIEAKFYLDDDFNDNLVHFGIASERKFLLNNGDSHLISDDNDLFDINKY